MDKAACVLQIGLSDKLYALLLPELNAALKAKGLLTRAMHIRPVPAKTKKPGTAPLYIVQFMGPAKEKRQAKKILADIKKQMKLVITGVASEYQLTKPSQLDIMLASVDLSDIKIDSSDIGRGGLITGEHVDWMLPGSRKGPPMFRQPPTDARAAIAAETLVIGGKKKKNIVIGGKPQPKIRIKSKQPSASDIDQIGIGSKHCTTSRYLDS